MSEKTLSDSGFSQVTQSCLLPRRPKLPRMPEMLETARPAFWTDRPAAARLRPPRQRPVVVDVLAAAAGIGLGVTIGLEVDRRERRLAERARRRRDRARPLGRPTRRLRDGGRRAARRARAAARARDRPGPARRLAPQARPVAAVPPARPRRAHHRRLRAPGAATACCTSSASCCGPIPASSPRRPARPPVRGRHHARTGSRGGGWPTRPGGRCTSTPTSRCSCRSRTRSTRAPRSSGTRRASVVDGAVARDAGLVVAARIGLPLWRSLRHQVRVVAVRPEGPGVVSIVLRGRRLDRLPVAGGQFFQWRFLRRGLWWQAHPYSLSAAPDGDLLRITVKDLGDHSAGAGAPARPGRAWRSRARTARSRPTRADARPGAAVGAGVGIAPILALLQELPPETDVAVLLRASTPAELVLRDEVAAEVAAARRPAARARRLARRGAPRRRRAAPPRARRARARRLRVRPRRRSRHRLAAELRARRRARAAASTSNRSRSEEPHAPRPHRPRRTVVGTAAVLAFHPHSRRSRPRPAGRGHATPHDRHRHAGDDREPGARTATGDAVDTQYGAAQVRVTVKGGKITKIEALQLQGNDPRRCRSRSSAEPVLQQEALAKQSADDRRRQRCDASRARATRSRSSPRSTSSASRPPSQLPAPARRGLSHGR